MDQDAPAKLLDVPRNFRVRVSGIRRHQFHLCGISVEKYVITDLDFLAGSVSQSWGRHEFSPTVARSLSLFSWFHRQSVSSRLRRRECTRPVLLRGRNLV